jgi:hypothetical protein
MQGEKGHRQGGGHLPSTSKPSATPMVISPPRMPASALRWILPQELHAHDAHRLVLVGLPEERDYDW